MNWKKKFVRNWGRLGMKCKLSDICVFRKGKVDVSKLTLKTYISTENMLPNKGGVTEASSLPTVQLTQEYKKGDILVSNIRPYFKKIWQAKCDGGCSNDVLVFQGNSNIDGDFLYYILANDDFFAYSMATSKGTKMPRGDKTSIMQYEVPIFDIDTQRRNGSLDDVTLDGKVYGIPVSVEGYGLVYNKEIFKDAGIDASTLTSYDAIDKAFADLQNQIDSGKLKDKYPQLEAVEEYAAKETWIPGLHTLNAPLACEYSSATELRNSDQLGLKYADSLKALLDLETKYTTSKDDLSKLNAVDYSSEIGGGLAIERVAVVQQGNWIGPELSGIDEEVANKMGILPIPLKGVKEDCIPTGISIYWCINSQSGDKEKEASKEFLKWLFQSDEGKQIVVNDFGFVPAFNNYDDVEITDTLSKEVKRYIDEGKTLPWVMGGFPSGYEPKAAADFQGYFSGEYTFDQMVDQLKADFVELKK